MYGITELEGTAITALFVFSAFNMQDAPELCFQEVDTGREVSPMNLRQKSWGRHLSFRRTDTVSNLTIEKTVHYQMVSNGQNKTSLCDSNNSRNSEEGGNEEYCKQPSALYVIDSNSSIVKQNSQSSESAVLDTSRDLVSFL